MDVLPHNFFTCQLCGLWMENTSYYVLKMISRVIVIFIITQFTLSLVIEAMTTRGTLDEFAEVLFMTFTYVALYLKIMNLLTRRTEMCNILKYFQLPSFKPHTPEEEEIIKKYADKAAGIFLFIMSTSQSSGTILIIVPLLPLLGIGHGKVELPFKAYQPYDLSIPMNFGITYAIQSLSLIFGIILNVALDTMAYGFIILATGQFVLNCYRLEHSTVSLKECIKHQVLIQEVIAKIQDFFIRTIVPLFCLSLITLCTSIFRISQKKVASIEFWSLTTYLACMLCQVFFYCWYGNELELKNKIIMDAVYTSKWIDYTNKEKKNMWFVMLSTQSVSTISFHGQCGLTLNTFIWIAKTSYASFNLLNSMKQKD